MSSRLLSSLCGAPGSFATTTPFDQPRRSLPRRYFDEIDAPLELTAGRRVEVYGVTNSEQCPVVPGAEREDWPLQDPKELATERVREIRDEIERRVAVLVASRGWRR